MRYLIILSLVFFFSQSNSAQTRTMNNAESGGTYNAETQARTVQPLLQEAERQFRALDYEGTFFTLENAVAQNPNSPEALLMRARFKKMVGMQTEAEMDLRLANSINPYAANLYGYHGNGGLLKIMAIEPERAVQELNTLQKLNYYYHELDMKMVREKSEDSKMESFEKVIIDIESNHLIDALTEINSIIKSYPNSAIAYDLKGVILKKQGKFEDAFDAFIKAVEIEPEFAIAHYNLGKMEQSRGNFDKAKIHLDKSIELQDDLTKAYFARAVLYKQMGDKENALEDYNTVIDMKGETYLEAFLNRGLTKKMLGDYGGALADFNRIIEEFPQNAELRKNRGNLQMLFGLNRKAIDDYTKAIELNNNYAEAYYNRGLAFLLMHDKISGCADLDRSIDLGYELGMETRLYFCTE